VHVLRKSTNLGLKN